METNNFYFLMHKDIEVCIISFSANYKISKIQYIDKNKKHIPLGAQLNNSKLIEWWKDRAIPKTRHNVKTSLEKLGYDSTENALINNLGLSLTDCYWIKPYGSNIKWKDVNLFSNEFTDEIGELSFKKNFKINLKNKTKFSPASSQGELKKKWCIDKNGKRFMVKGNYGQSYQQSLNEIFAMAIYQQCKFNNFTKYYLTDLITDENKNGLGVLSYNFCNENVEFVSAWELLQKEKRRGNDSCFEILKKVCLSLGMKTKDFHNYMDFMLLTDYLITNTDRHLNNFGILRNPNTLKLIGFAPIFDSGNSMFYNVNLESLKHLNINKITTSGLVDREVKILKFISNRKIINLNKINPRFDIYLKDIEENNIRIPELKRLFNEKLNNLKLFQSGIDIWKSSYIKK